MIGEIIMNLERKVKIQQTLIDQLQEEKQQLIKENKELRNEINSKKTHVTDNKDNVGQLQKELQKCIREYNEINKSLQNTKNEYEKKLDEIKVLKKEYKQKMDAIIKSVKKGL